MKVWSGLINHFKSGKKIFLFGAICFLPVYATVYAQAVKKTASPHQEVPLTDGLNLSLKAKNNPLHLNYPDDVNQIYRMAGKKLLWLAPDTVKTHAADAMMMLDCVLQYGLSHDDYHPRELQYDKLSLYTSKFAKTSFTEKSRLTSC